VALLINNEFVDDEAFLTQFRQMGGLNIDPNHPAARLEAETLSRLAEERVIGFTLLRQQASAEGFTITAAEVEAKRQAEWGTSSASVCGAGVQQAMADALLVEKYCTWLTRHEPRPSRTEVEACYRSRREDFRMPEQAQLTQVVRNIYLPEDEAPARSAMEQAEQQLQAGKPFRDVAERYSDCGGRIILGWVKRGEMVAEFEDVVFAMSKGQRSAIFRTVFGLHIVQVLDRKQSGYQSLDEVRPVLARQMLQMRRDQRVTMEVRQAMQRATIVPVAATSADMVAR
jgi:parvulin-like peptidyl-prolyl isomerase